MRFHIHRKVAAASAGSRSSRSPRARARAAARHEPAGAERAAAARQLGVDGADDRRQAARDRRQRLQLRHDRQGDPIGGGAAAQPLGQRAPGADGDVREQRLQLHRRCPARPAGSSRPSTRSTARSRTTRTTTSTTTARSSSTRRHLRPRRASSRPARCRAPRRARGSARPGPGSGNNGPGAGQAATDFPPDGIILRPFTQTNVVANPTTGACSQFPNKQYSSYQYQDGAIPSSTALMRFGLMTFDQDPSPGIGVTTGATHGPRQRLRRCESAFYGAFSGMWSYFPGWNTGGVCPHTGEPVNCTTPQLLAVGARNPAAPPWEGRMMPFPATNDLATQESEQPEHRQRRPRGAAVRRDAARGHARRAPSTTSGTTRTARRRRTRSSSAATARSTSSS